MNIYKVIIYICIILYWPINAIINANWFYYLMYIINLFDDKELKKIDSKLCEDRTIVLYDGNKVDITNYLTKHPGGSCILKKYENKEISIVMKKIKHSDEAYKILNSMII